jgi:tryptophanyl-tRNA synthetase
VLVEYLAAGIDPEKATIYIQSDVPEVAELYLYLNMNAYLGELERATSFKDKVRANPITLTPVCLPTRYSWLPIY